MNDIKTYPRLPKDKDVFHVATPVGIRLIFLIGFASALFAIIWLISTRLEPGWIISTLVTGVLVGFFSLITVQALKIESWVSFSMSTGGVYFPSTATGEVVFVPWRYIGEIAPGIFGANKRGLMFEILESAVEAPIANIIADTGNDSAVWVQVKSDLLNREKLILKAKALRSHHC